MSKKEKKEEKEKVENKTTPKKVVKKEKLSLIQLFNESKHRQSMMLGALDYNGLLNDFREDLINEKETVKLTVEEFEEMIKKYQNRRL